MRRRTPSPIPKPIAADRPAELVAGVSSAGRVVELEAVVPLVVVAEFEPDGAEAEGDVVDAVPEGRTVVATPGTIRRKVPVFTSHAVVFIGPHHQEAGPH
jgi:hypothetical protein